MSKPNQRFGFMKAKSMVRLAAFLLLLTVCGQGCVVWPYMTTPLTSGIILDAATRQPIPGAKVGFREHTKSTRTKPDGTFVLRPGYTWGPAFIIPYEFNPCGGVFFVEAEGYLTFEQDVTRHVYHPLAFPEPIVLQRRTDQ